MKKVILTLFLLVSANALLAQQGYNSSQWNQAPSLFNAGSVATGNEDYSFFTNFRFQYFTIEGAPMRTNTLSTEFKFSDGAYSKNNFGVGLNVINDQTGDNKLMTTAVTIPVNYTIQLDQRNKLSVGVAPGFYMQSYDPATLNWGSDWTGNGFNGNYGDPIYINSNLSRSSYGAFDVNSGIFYQHTQRNKSRFYGGLAFNHMTRQKIDFSFTADRMYMQMVVNAGADITTRRRDFRLQPQMMYFRNGPSNNFVLGVNCENILSSGSEITNINKSKTVSYGVFYRMNDAVIASFSYKIQNFKIGIAFDANVSRLSSATSGVGAIEIFFKSIHMYGKKKTKLRKD